LEDSRLFESPNDFFAMALSLWDPRATAEAVVAEDAKVQEEEAESESAAQSQPAEEAAKRPKLAADGEGADGIAAQ
jgi:hypothetical protein